MPAPSPEERLAMSYDYEVALSFAGEQREYVNRVAIALKVLGIKVFYDGFEEENLWGKNLYEYLHHIYSSRARYTVIFISKDYAKKLWTSHERKSAQERAFRESKEYILPGRFDDTAIPGLSDMTGYVDCTKRTPENFAELIAKKLGYPVPEKTKKDPSFHFRDVSFSQSTLLGLLVLAGTRAWCVATSVNPPQGAIVFSRNVAIILNEGEAFKKKQRQGVEALAGVKDLLNLIAETVGCSIQLHNPLLLADSTYDRFIKTDKRYILNFRENLQPFRAPLPNNPDSHLILLSEEGGAVVAFAAPSDYARDAFGIEVHRDKRHKDAIYLKETALFRNAKFVAIDAKSGRVLAMASIDSSLELSATHGSRSDVVSRIQESVATERRPVQFNSSSHVVEMDEQSARKKVKAYVQCKLCQDVKEMVVSHNLRLYRVPCPDCNGLKNKSWSAFTSAFDYARKVI